MEIPLQDAAALEQQAKSGASWFYWIAGLSIINSVVALSGGDFSFVIGLGITQIFDAIAHELKGGMALKGTMFVLDLLVVGMYALFGIFASKRYSWAFIVGMVLYALDALLLLAVQQWLSVGFHAFAMYCIFNGFRATQQLRKAQSTPLAYPTMPMPSTLPPPPTSSVQYQSGEALPPTTMASPQPAASEQEDSPVA